MELFQLSTTKVPVLLREVSPFFFWQVPLYILISKEKNNTFGEPIEKGAECTVLNFSNSIPYVPPPPIFLIK